MGDPKNERPEHIPKKVMIMFKTVTSQVKPKAFAWSFSRLKNFETCPRKYQQVDVLKAYGENTEQLDWGNAVHKALAENLSKGTPLPVGMEDYKSWRDNIVTEPQDYKLLVEQQLAITIDFKPTKYFANDVWFRAVVDVAKIRGRIALCVDWKTGKIIDDSVQLALTAQCIFAHHPEVEYVRSEYVWLKEDATTGAVLKRSDMMGLWSVLLPRVNQLKHATDTGQYPPKPSGLCRKYCPVTSCEHNGR